MVVSYTERSWKEEGVLDTENTTAKTVGLFIYYPYYKKGLSFIV
jgi:hypothetical protein